MDFSNNFIFVLIFKIDTQIHTQKFFFYFKLFFFLNLQEMQNPQTQTQNSNTQKIENSNPNSNLWVFLGVDVLDIPLFIFINQYIGFHVNPKRHI